MTPEREQIMQAWDKWRAYIANGGGGSWPRDAFESLLDDLDEKCREAEANALRRAAEAQCDGCRLSGAPDRYGKHAEPTPIKCQALSIRSLLSKEEGK